MAAQLGSSLNFCAGFDHAGAGVKLAVRTVADARLSHAVVVVARAVAVGAKVGDEGLAGKGAEEALPGLGRGGLDGAALPDGAAVGPADGEGGQDRRRRREERRGEQSHLCGVLRVRQERVGLLTSTEKTIFIAGF